MISVRMRGRLIDRQIRGGIQNLEGMIDKNGATDSIHGHLIMQPFPFSFPIATRTSPTVSECFQRLFGNSHYAGLSRFHSFMRYEEKSLRRKEHTPPPVFRHAALQRCYTEVEYLEMNMDRRDGIPCYGGKV